MDIKLQFLSNTTTVSERMNSQDSWKQILTGDSHNVTVMTRRTLKSLEESKELVLSEYYDDLKGNEEYIFSEYVQPQDDPKIYGISQYHLAKLVESSAF